MSELRDRLNRLYQRAENDPSEKDSGSSSAMSSMRKELKRLFGKHTDKFFVKSDVERKSHHLDELVPGNWINTHFGDIFRAEYQYDLSKPYGQLDLRRISQFKPSDYQHCFQIEALSAPDKFLFIDTETTGLTGGTGTIAFMIGIGWLDDQQFHIHQYFITQLSHEEGMLELLKEVLSRFTVLISYNGKAYDLPLLNTRFLLNRMPAIPDEMIHLDLLHYNRSLWRYSMENCQLKTIERDLLGLTRNGDIPGELIPSTYFNYLNSGLCDAIESIFFHNRFDVITMLANLILILDAYRNQLPEKNPLDDYAKGRIFRRKKDFQRSIRHYKNALQARLSPSRRLKTMLELAALYKRDRQWEKALPLWKAALADSFPFALKPYLELAKYYEHHHKDYHLALKFAERAVKTLPPYRDKELQQLEKRIARLQQKIKIEEQ